MNRDVRLININITINNKKYKDLILNSTEGESSISKTDGIDLGACVSEYISFNIYDPLKELSSNIIGKDIKVEYIVLNNNDYNKVYHNYYVIDTKRETDVFTIEAQDFLFKTEKNLSLITNIESGTVKDYLEAISKHIGCSYSNIKHSEVLNIRLKDIDLKKYSGRDILSSIAAYNGGFCRMSDDHKVIEFINLLDSYNKSIKDSSYDKTKMLIYDEVGEVLSLDGIQYDYSVQIGKYPYVYIRNNIIIENIKKEDKHINHLTNILNELKQIKYSPVEGVMFFEPDVRGGDFVRFNSVNGDYITLLSSINYGLGGKTKFKSYALSLIDNLKPTKEDIEVIEEPEEPTDPEEPELPDFKLEITGYRKPKKILYLKKGVVNKNDDIWVRVDVVDSFKFIPDNYNDDTYKSPGTEGYITEEGEYGEGSYSLIATIGNIDFYERYITPNYSLNITKDLEGIDENKLRENIINFDKYFKIEGNALWVKSIVESEESRDKLIIPSSYTYNIGLKNNNYIDERYDDEYYHGEGKLCLVDHNNLAWYGLDDVIQTYEMDKHVMDHTSIVYIDEDDNRERIPDVREIGMYGDLKDKLVENSIGGVQHNGIKKELYSIMVDEIEYVDLRNINSFPQKLKKREYLYSEHDKGDYLKMVYFNIGHEVIITDRWYRSRFSISPRGVNIREALYKAMGDWDWEWNFYRKGYLYDEYGGYDSSHYYPEIWALMKPHPDTTREYIESFFYTIDNRDYETTYTKEVLTEIILNDIKNKGELTKEITFKPFVDDEKNKIYYKRRLIWGRRSDPIWKVGECDIPKYSEFDIYKEYGKEKICTMYIRQEDIERDYDNETKEEFIERVRGEYGEMYAMEVKDRENKNIHIPINQYLTTYSGWPDDYEDLPFNYEADAPIIFPRMAAANISNTPKMNQTISKPLYTSKKIKNKYYWILNTGYKGELLELYMNNNLNKTLYLYTVKNNEIMDKYTSSVSDIGEARFTINDNNYDKLIVMGDYAADLKEGVLYDKNRQNKTYTYIDNSDTINIEDMKGVNKIWNDY